ncbi:MAG: lipoyl(octanoyl) transferase LipB [Kofleriaceae bacterium]|nr:lipoyl(octanoyl) transferase LipB [Kofleriaceae bacterium]
MVAAVATAHVWKWLGRAEYRAVLDAQLAERERVWAGAPGTIFLCEHPPVITLGRSANTANVLAAGDVPLERIERGGDVTYHGPGQLMVYPVVRLKHGVVDFLETIARVLADACAAFGAPGAAFKRDPAGLYLDGAKMAACGIHVARGVSVHGFALDVATPRDAWQRIRPCGLCLVQTSLAGALEARGLAPVSVEQVAAEVGPKLAVALL